MRKVFLSLIISILLFVCQDACADWTITQYSSETGNMAMIYTIVNTDTGALAIIDGGYTGDQEQIRGIIEQYGKVDAWILTHYHEDHAGAFNAVWNDTKDRIEKVYTTALDTKILEDNCQNWDDPGTLAMFLDQASSDERVIALHTGDEVDIVGLKMQVYLSGDDEILKYMINVWNNCSLVFKLKGSEEEILFLGDLQNQELGTYLLEKYGENELHAKYVQPSHHGNWGLATEFYQSIKPECLLFDAPEWLMTGEKYTARFLKEWCDQQGITTYDYRDAPTTIIIR